MRWRIASFLAVTAILLFPTCANAQIAEIAKAQVADPLAQYVKASRWVSADDGPVFVELLMDQRDAGLRIRSANNEAPQVKVLNSPSDVLKLLADKRMKFLWQPLTEWAGPDLAKMRDQRLAQLRAAAAAGDAKLPPSTSSESAVRPKLRAIMQLAEFLVTIGRSTEAESLLQQQLGTMKVQTDASWDAIEWFSMASWIGTARVQRNDFAGAISQYAFIEDMLGDSPYAQNATINRAALLVQTGHYQNALDLINPLWERWSRVSSEYKVAGSERQFAWIRACALEGLGEHAEAQLAFVPVVEAKNTHDPDYVIDSDDALKLKGLVCMKQTAAVTKIIADGLEHRLSSDALLLMQPAFRPKRDVEFWEKVRSDPTLVKLARGRERVLPKEMTPALNDWR